MALLPKIAVRLLKMIVWLLLATDGGCVATDVGRDVATKVGCLATKDNCAATEAG